MRQGLAIFTFVLGGLALLWLLAMAAVDMQVAFDQVDVAARVDAGAKTRFLIILAGLPAALLTVATLLTRADRRRRHLAIALLWAMGVAAFMVLSVAGFAYSMAYEGMPASDSPRGELHTAAALYGDYPVTLLMMAVLSGLGGLLLRRTPPPTETAATTRAAPSPRRWAFTALMIVGLGIGLWLSAARNPNRSAGGQAVDGRVTVEDACKDEARRACAAACLSRIEASAPEGVDRAAFGAGLRAGYELGRAVSDSPPFECSKECTDTTWREWGYDCSKQPRD